MGVDIKADGGYIVVSPSIHPRTGGPYQWIGSFADDLTPLPQDWVDRLREPERQARSSPLSLPVAGGNRYAVGALRRQLGELLGALEGDEERHAEPERVRPRPARRSGDA